MYTGKDQGGSRVLAIGGVGVTCQEIALLNSTKFDIDDIVT